MTDRITKATLQDLIARFNELHGRNISLDCAYGGYKITSESGGNITSRGTARETYDGYWAYRRGYEDGKDAAKMEA